MTPLQLAPLAVTAGAVSFASPCVLPLLPGYLAYMTGLPDGEGRGGRRPRVRAAVFFVIGFSLVFTILGSAVALTGATAARHLPQVGRASGVVLILAGATTAGALRMPAFLQRERRPGLSRAPRGPRGAIVLGAAFAAGWSPCIGPVLASILAMSAQSHSASWGAGLLLLYSAGLGIPFLMVAFATERTRWVQFLQARARVTARLSGAALVVVGVLMITGSWTALLQPLQRDLAQFNWPPI